MRSLFHSRASKTMLIALVAATPACDGGAEDAAAKEAAETGAIRAALTVGGLRHDVVAVHYKVVAADGTSMANIVELVMVPNRSTSPIVVSSRCVADCSRFITRS